MVDGQINKYIYLIIYLFVSLKILIEKTYMRSAEGTQIGNKRSITEIVSGLLMLGGKMEWKLYA